MQMLDYTDPQQFKDHLLFLHGLMKASEPLLMHAISKSRPGVVRSYYEQHLIEETGHVCWLEADLATAGVIPPLVHWKAAQIAGTQAYLIECVSPNMLLGYMAALELNPPTLDLIDNLERLYGSQLLRTFRYHAVHDPTHGQDLIAVITTLDKHEQALVLENARRTMEAL